MTRANAATRAYEHATLSFGMVSIPVSVFAGTASDHGISRKMIRPVPVMEPELAPDGTEVLVDGKPKLIQKHIEATEPDLEADGTPKMDAENKPVRKPVLDEAGKPVMVPVFEDHSVGYASLDKTTGEIIDRSEVVRKVETEYGLVFVEPEEIEQKLNLTPKSIQILSFQPQHIFYQGIYVPKSLYFVEAQKVKVGKGRKDSPQAIAALAMLLKAMKAESAIAVVEFTTRGVPKPAVLLPDGTLWEVYFEEELREPRPLPEVPVDQRIVDQARMLLKMSWNDQPLELSDRRTALIQGLADEKARAGDFGKPEESAEPEAPAASDDLMAALMASLGGAQPGQAASA